jgi:hypothetical protein
MTNRHYLQSTHKPRSVAGTNCSLTNRVKSSIVNIFLEKHLFNEIPLTNPDYRILNHVSCLHTLLVLQIITVKY